MGNGKRCNRILRFGMGAMLLLGCSSVVWGETPAPAKKDAVQELQAQIITLRSTFNNQIARMERDQQTIYEHVQPKLTELMNRQQGLNTAYPEYAAQVKQFGATMDAYNEKIAALEQTVTTIETMMNDNLAALEKRIGEVKKSNVNRPSDDQKSGGESIREFSIGQVFRAAYRFYMDGDYETAIAGFQKLLAEYPQHQLAGAAQYWIAESFARLDEYPTAIQEYDRMIKNYPHNDKLADAYYGKGLALSKLGQATDATAMFTYVQQHFPGTVAAKKAEDQLKNPQ
jgi:tol-pal system protein YbgF